MIVSMSLVSTHPDYLEFVCETSVVYSVVLILTADRKNLNLHLDNSTCHSLKYQWR